MVDISAIGNELCHVFFFVRNGWFDMSAIGNELCHVFVHHFGERILS